MDEEVHVRQFDGWSMGFRVLSKLDMRAFPEAAYLFQCKPQEIEMRVMPGSALIILKSFADKAN